MSGLLILDRRHHPLITSRSFRWMKNVQGWPDLLAVPVLVWRQTPLAAAAAASAAVHTYWSTPGRKSSFHPLRSGTSVAKGGSGSRNPSPPRAVSFQESQQLPLEPTHSCPFPLASTPHPFLRWFPLLNQLLVVGPGPVLFSL